MYMEIPDEVFDLLWFGDGEYKNFEEETSDNKLYRTVPYEPSAIYVSYSVSDNVNYEHVESPGYYPNYKDLSPDQKRVYLDYLENIYDNSFDISYVFLFYYGLERHLLKNEKFDEAFRTILKLRKEHPNSSFQSYSANALLFSALKYERTDMVKEFLKSYKDSYGFSDKALFYVLCKLKIPLTAEIIMDNAKFFGFNRKKYIRKYPEDFLKTLQSEMIKNYSNDEILISDFINEEQLKDINEVFQFIYANYCIEERTINIPDISSSEEFSKEIYNLLLNTEEIIKETFAKKK